MDLDIFELVKQFGPFVGFTVFFVWQGWIREKRLSDRIDELAKEQRETLTKLVADTTSALVRSSIIIENDVEAMKNLSKAIDRFEMLLSQQAHLTDKDR